MTKIELISQFLNIRRISEQICKPLQTEDYVIQPVEDVSPPKWHLAHTTWFFEQFIIDKYLDDYEPYHPSYYYLFNSYYHSMGDRWSRPDRGVLSRPTVKEVYEYRIAITEKIVELYENISEKDREEFYKLLELGCHHEQQHQELLMTDIKYILSVNPIEILYIEKIDQSAVAESDNSSFTAAEGGMFNIGFAGDGFCFDNERPEHQVYVNNFNIQNRLVTNREYLEFIEAGAYSDYRHWLADAWEYVQKNNWQSPLHWKCIDDKWYEFTLHGLREVVPGAPVTHVSYYEAEAYAGWKGKRLPTEMEWEIVARKLNPDPASGHFYDDGYYHPRSVNHKNEQDLQLLGDAWEWTNSSYLAYPGYMHDDGALGEYNGKFMVDQMVLRGGSCVTPRNHMRLTYRNFFQTEKRWQFTGIRLAESG